MISLSNYFENDKLILQETLVDNIFDLIDTNTLDSQINTSGIVQLKQKLENYTHVKLEFWKNQNNQVDGDFERPNIINIYLHSNATYGDVLQVFLHEFSHFVTDHKLPILVKFKKPSFGNVLFTDNKDNIRNFLDYIFQLRELPNFALSFAFDIFLYYQKDNTNSIIKKNKNIIDNHNSRDQEFTYYFMSLSKDIKLLFQIQYFIKIVKKSEYLRKFIRMKKLIEKYRRRIKQYF